jgi:glycerol-3-phosphate O-acyltransferase/dihydroxyacetone phosphate acyltransferase
MALGDFVRLSKTFLDVFKAATAHVDKDTNGITATDQTEFPVSEVKQLCIDLKVGQGSVPS